MDFRYSQKACDAFGASAPQGGVQYSSIVSLVEVAAGQGLRDSNVCLADELKRGQRNGRVPLKSVDGASTREMVAERVMTHGVFQLHTAHQ